jgi:putative ABC transport system permease protein
VNDYIPVSYGDLALASLLVLANAALSLYLQLGVHGRMVVAALRSMVQLTLVGLVLTALFAHVALWWTALAFAVMVAFAGREATARQDRPLGGGWSYGIGTGSVTAAVLVTVLALLTTVRPDPWYDPRYAVPLLGMILGNTMTGVALGLNTLTIGVATRRAAVEARLMLGAGRLEAMGPVVRQALRSALLPIINSMAATGVVSLPGMMTGQILGGVAPAEAVKYQILVLFLIAGATGLGAVAAVLAGARRLTDGRHRLRLDRLAPGKG